MFRFPALVQFGPLCQRRTTVHSGELLRNGLLQGSSAAFGRVEERFAERGRLRRLDKVQSREVTVLRVCEVQVESAQMRSE